MQSCWEVEQKYVVDWVEGLVANLADLSAQVRQAEEHVDTYLTHPARDFRQTDEAFRMRRVNASACVTYKGPRLSGPVKARQEIELQIDARECDQWLQMLTALGFRALPIIEKSRRVYGVLYNFREFVVAIDDVKGLGRFAEVELIVSDPADLAAARQAVQELCNRLGLHQLQPKSYLAQMLSKLGNDSPGD